MIPTGVVTDECGLQSGMQPKFEVIRADAKIAGGGPDGLRMKLEWSGFAPTGLAQRQTALGLLRLPGFRGGDFTPCEPASPSVFSLVYRFSVQAVALEHFYLVVIKWWSSGGGVVA